MYCRSTSTDLKFHGASSVAIEEAVLLLRPRRRARGACPLRLGALCACRLVVWLVRWRLGPPSDVVPHIHGGNPRPSAAAAAPTLEVYPRWPRLGYALVCSRLTSETGHSWHHFAGFIGRLFAVRARSCTDRLHRLSLCLGTPCTHPSLTLAHDVYALLAFAYATPCSPSCSSVRCDLPVLACMCGTLGAR